MCALDDATFGRLSICGATRRVRIFVKLGDLADLEAPRLCIYVERADVVPTSAEVLSPGDRGREDLPIMGG